MLNEFAIAETSLDFVLVARNEKGICALFLGDDPTVLESELKRRFPRPDWKKNQAGMSDVLPAILAAIESPSTACDLPLDLAGTDFQRSVWKALCDIPAGSTMSYSEIARRINRPRSVRAVGTACGANAISILIPCHRALRSDGSLAGFRWGIERKRELLRREQASATRLK